MSTYNTKPFSFTKMRKIPFPSYDVLKVVLMDMGNVFGPPDGM